MPRTYLEYQRHLAEAEKKFPFVPCKQASTTKYPIPCQVTQALYHDTCLVFLILSNVVFDQALSKIRPKITLYALSTSYETR